MSDFFHNMIRFLWTPPFWVSSTPVVIGLKQTRRAGAYILAAGNHQSPFDIPVLIRHNLRRIDFVSITEVFSKPLVGWFYGLMNAFPLDRSRRDPKTVRIILDRLQRGRVVGMFPEGAIRRGNDSVIHNRRIRSGVGRIATLAQVPVIPCVIVNSIAYTKVLSWSPTFSTKYGLIFGEPIPPTMTAEEIERKLVDDYVVLHAQLKRQMSLSNRP